MRACNLRRPDTAQTAHGPWQVVLVIVHVGDHSQGGRYPRDVHVSLDDTEQRSNPTPYTQTGHVHIRRTPTQRSSREGHSAEELAAYRTSETMAEILDWELEDRLRVLDGATSYLKGLRGVLTAIVNRYAPRTRRWNSKPRWRSIDASTSLNATPRTRASDTGSPSLSVPSTSATGYLWMALSWRSSSASNASRTSTQTRFTGCGSSPSSHATGTTTAARRRC